MAGTASKQGNNRKQQILESLAQQLESNGGGRITTAGLAKAVGVSEAALYRHFPSKAYMFEGLIEFAEQAVFSRVNRVLSDKKDPEIRCELILGIVLGFSSRNPGITRLLLGEALMGEPERLRKRSGQYFSRLETQLKQVLREGRAVGRVRADIPTDVGANLMLAILEGRMRQFIRSDFSLSPLEHWELQWALLTRTLFLSVD
ncbi:MAG TPA: nucleoid occlusion factor SlmA [Gammaproteobacteria bacterium]|nr:nucleoid occlusion factor SlmA [Gammaproteobacteria bacterium]